MQPLRHVGEIVAGMIDRPMGSTHPLGGWAYLVNCGFIPGAVLGDGEELDAYVLGVDEPLSEFRQQTMRSLEATGFRERYFSSHVPRSAV